MFSSNEEFVQDPDATQIAQVPVVVARDSHVHWQSQWGVTGSFVALVSGTNNFITDVPPSGKKIVATELVLANSSGVNQTVTLKEETSLFQLQQYIVPTGQTLYIYPRNKIKTLASGRRLILVPANAGIIANIGYYYET